MTWQRYSPPDSFTDGDEPSMERTPAYASRARNAPAARTDPRNPAGDGRTSKVNFRGPRAKLQRYRRVRIIGGAAAAAVVAVGAIALIQNGNAAAAPNPNCTIIVPANPLSAAGLATPYQLTATNPRNGRCNEANAAQSAFVQGAII